MKNLEKQILNLLNEDCRYTAEKIAVMLGVAESEVAAAIKQMEQNGVIVKYAAITNAEAMDDEVVEALIEVKVTPKKGQGFDALAQEISHYNEVTGVYLMSGTYDLAVFVSGKSLKSISRFVYEKISTFSGVTGTATHFILRKYKIEGNVTVQDSQEKRLSVQP
ncbi:MAG: Lrp/AsnC family transcriptional regulator [Clostridia bacterium]|nr:Lrp/AsnC family transcriptional regulator [Clostridia bacterium]